MQSPWETAEQALTQDPLKDSSNVLPMPIPRAPKRALSLIACSPRDLQAGAVFMGQKGFLYG